MPHEEPFLRERTRDSTISLCSGSLYCDTVTSFLAQAFHLNIFAFCRLHFSGYMARNERSRVLILMPKGQSLYNAPLVCRYWARLRVFLGEHNAHMRRNFQESQLVAVGDPVSNGSCNPIYQVN